MKHYLLLMPLIFILASCNNKSAQKKLDIENAQQAIALTRIVGIGKITPENDIIQLSSPVNGIVQKIYKKENDEVNIGTVILELDHELEDAKIVQLITEVNTQSAQIKVDAASVGEFDAKASNATMQLQRLQKLLLNNAETQQAVDDETTNLKVLNFNVKKLEAVVAVSKSKLKEIKATLNTAQVERNQKIITSPIAGRILELTVLIGGSVSTLQSFGQITPKGKTIAICEIDESNAGKVFVGQKGWIRNVGSADTLSTGTVYFAATFLKKKSLFTDQSGEKEDRRVRTIKMMLDNPNQLLLNARVECVLDIANQLKK